MKNTLSPLVRLWLTVRYRLLSRRYNRLTLEWVDGVPLIVLPQVFNPVLLRTGQFMVQSFEPFEWAGKRVLDLGSGSGIGAIFAARRGASVVAVDINPQAVRSVRLNSLLNRLEPHVRVYQGDLLDALPRQPFDRILFNPPFYRGAAKDNLDYAWRGVNIFERFVAQLPHTLKPNGELLLMLSSDGNGDELLELLRQNRFTITIVHHHDFINEQLTLYCVVRES